jgi:hypothetical protein
MIPFILVIEERKSYLPSCLHSPACFEREGLCEQGPSCGNHSDTRHSV